MPQISGWIISALDNRPLFIFTTAYAHYAVWGIWAERKLIIG